MKKFRILLWTIVFLSICNYAQSQIMIANITEDVQTDFGMYHPYPATFTDNMQPAWITHYCSGLLPGNDAAIDVVIDSDGNIYVTGSSVGPATDYDYATIKYNSSGVQEWVARFNGQGSSFDSPSAIAVDSTGNVYVTGNSSGDYMTVKYNSDGVEQWSARYNGPGDSKDEPVAIAVDGFGNVYVTGTSIGSDTLPDYATIKYNSKGEKQWVVRYGEGGRSAAYATGLVIDDSCNVYVTGISWKSGSFFSIKTIKYNSDGGELWVASYGGGSIRVVDIENDDFGNVYITGYRAGPSSMNDYIIIKYNSDGNMMWERFYDYNGWGDVPTDLTVDGSGYVYVTGYSWSPNSDYHFATVKYSPNGVLQWTARSSVGEATALAVDSTGNIYVTGGYITIKYNTDGIEQWTARSSSCRATALTVDRAGNIYITGSGKGDFAIVKFNTDGLEQWVTSYDGPGTGRDGAIDIALDRTGNIYVTGYSEAPETYFDYVTVKYSSDGVEQWVVRYSGSGNNFDKPVAIGVDSLGNVYVTGKSKGVDASDFATVKYNSEGEEQWVVRYIGTEDSNNYPTGLVVDGSGNVYVAGHSSGDYVTIKYDTDGVEQWITRYNGPGDGEDEPVAIEVDEFGNVYVTGKSEGQDTYDFATVKYNSDGEEQWVARYNGPENSTDAATDIVIDGSGNVYVTGTVKKLDDYYSFYFTTVKYNPSGMEEWVARYNDSAGVSTAIALDDSGNVYVLGTIVLSWHWGWEWRGGLGIVKYDLHGEKEWDAVYDNGYEILAIDLVVDSSGNVYGVGNTRCCGDLIAMEDYLTVKYNPDGTEGWVAQYNTLYSLDRAAAMALDRTGNAYVTGTSLSSVGQIFTTIKYSETPSVSVNKKEVNLPGSFSLYQNYPNPFNPETTIRFDLPRNSHIKLVIYNILGQKIKTLFNGEKIAGTHTIEWDGKDSLGRNVSSGIYLCRVETEDFVQVRKMVLLR